MDNHQPIGSLAYVLDIRHRQPWRGLLIVVFLAISVTIIYWPGLDGGFVFDDFPNLVDNPVLHVTRLVWNEWLAAVLSSPASSLRRPLSMLTFAINHYFTGLDPRPMKLTNIGIHALNAVLVFGLVRAIVSTALEARENDANWKAGWVAVFISACWALHPINLMAVLYVVQRMESLAHTFVFAGLWLYVSGRRDQLAGEGGGWRRILFGLVACTGFGLLAKESAILLPLYAICLEACLFHFHGGDQQRDRRLYVLFTVVLALPALLGLAWLLPKAMSAGAHAWRHFTFAERLLSEPRVVLTYLRWIVLPDLGQLSLYHDDYPPSRGLWNPASTMACLLAIPGLLVIAWSCRRCRPLVSLGLFWFFGAQLLTATIVPLELVFEHRNYFASLGICVALSDLLLLAPTVVPVRRIGAVLAVAFLLFCADVTHQRAIEWSSPLQFSMSEARKHPQSPRATYGLARAMVILTNYRVDSPYTARTFAALDLARKVPDSGVLADQALLMFAARTGRTLKAEWWTDMNEKLRQQPIGPQEISAIRSLSKCAVDKFCRFSPQSMTGLFDAALSQGASTEIQNIYGDYALNALGNTGLALQLWQEASKRKPDEPQYRINLARLLIALGRYDDARMQIAQLRSLGRLGQNEAAAQSLELRMRSRIDEQAHP